MAFFYSSDNDYFCDMKKLVWIMIVCLGFGVSSAQSIPDPARWKFEVNSLGSCYAELVFTANVETDWHLYSQKFSMNPLTFTFIKSDNFELVGTVSEPEPKKEYDPILEVDGYYFVENVVVFKQIIRIKSKTAFILNGDIFGQVCNLVKGICLIQKPTFSFTIEGCK